MAKKKGLGDVVQSITKVAGIEPCKGCKSKRDWLNVNFPFNKPRLLTEEEKLLIDSDPLKVYNDAFGTNIEEEQFVGGVKNSIIKKLTKLLNYEN